jgi:hypothetical protein
LPHSLRCVILCLVDWFFIPHERSCRDIGRSSSDRSDRRTAWGGGKGQPCDSSPWTAPRPGKNSLTPTCGNVQVSSVFAPTTC